MVPWRPHATNGSPRHGAHRRPGGPRHEKLNTRAASVVALAVLGSRVLGLVRDQVFGSLFGGGEVMDAFIMAFRIPNLLRDLFAEGALSTAFITVFSKTTALEGDRAAWELANKVATAAAVLVSFLHRGRHSRARPGSWQCWRTASIRRKRP